ncbi:uncharacterized protein B0T15DRAFT_554249 [Chaetomium strumarium]|uniref:2EXR domain-containing protein n=1 Tax=Chaetomium strumarium TaxID=1170767 RepID=A0AAJ0GWL2_9PEZI|nr:hypothetical protein B0T15DRAFT_554249 [Chaetomium strumarium]
MSTSRSSTSSSFTLFPYLPPELRLQIYRHSAHPRVTTLTYHFPTNTFTCSTHPPPLLHICHESRAEGLRLYTKCFLLPFPDAADPEDPSSAHQPLHVSAAPADNKQEKQKNGREEEEEKGGRYFYHHPDLDTLYLPRPPHPSAADPLGLGYADWARDFAIRLPHVAGAVRRLAVDYIRPEVRRPWEVYSKVCLIRGFLPKLEEAFMVISSSSSSGISGGGDDGEEGRGEAEGAEIELIDPRGDTEEIMGIMERVRESFRVEVGDGLGLGLGLGFVGQEDGGRGDGQKSGGGLELRPKSKVPSAWVCPPASVTCAW